MSVAAPAPDLDDAEAARRSPSASLARRMASFAYEATILFGIGLVPGALGAVLVRVLGAEAAWHAEGALRVVAFAVYGAYFVWFWSRRGQTLPMQTWHIRLVTRAGRPLSRRHALARYLLACAWVVPGWLAGTLAGLRGWPMLAAVAVNVVVWAALALARADRQFLHDAACGTRLVVWQARPAAAARPLVAPTR